MDGLGCSHQILTEPVAEVNVDFIEAALVVAETGKVLIHMLPLAVLLVSFHLEVSKEVALHLISVKEIVPLIDNGLIASAAQCLGFLCHALVVVLLALVLGLQGRSSVAYLSLSYVYARLLSCKCYSFLYEICFVDNRRLCIS